MIIAMSYTALTPSREKRIRWCVVSRSVLDCGEVWEYLKISIPSITMLCAEWWALELLSLMSSIIGVEAMGAQTIAFNFYILLFMVPIGF